MALTIGMIVFPRGLVTPQLYRIGDILGKHAELNPISLGAVPMQSPLTDLRRYRIRTTDEVSYNESLVTVRRIINPRSEKVYEYEVETEGGDTLTLPEYELTVHEGSLAPNPAEMLTQYDLAPAPLVEARTRLLESFFKATARSLGLVGYNGARMLPIPHQINAARYAVQFGRVRFLLADEVGLGKTIEAGLIVSTLRKYFPEWTIGIFVPESLTAQWAFEMYGKFGKMIFALELEEYDPEAEVGVILPHGRAADFAAEHAPQILVVDEAHRVLHDPKAVAALTKMSRGAHAVLLLTATPVSDDMQNLVRLLNILDPDVFAHLDTADKLRDLQARQGAIEEALKAIREPDPEADDVMRAWKEVGIADKEISRHLQAALKGDAARHELHKAATLIVDRYYPGARIIRYRRKFLSQENPMPLRVFGTIDYKPIPEEAKLVAAATDWLDAVHTGGLAKNDAAQRLAAALIQAVHSSSVAVADWLTFRRGQMERREGVTADPIRLLLRAGEVVPPLENEDELLEALENVNLRWQRASRAMDVSGRPIARSPRYEAFLKFIRATLKEDPEAHILIFTSFENNVRPLYLLLRKALQDDAEVFEMSGLMTRVEREKSAFEFQEVQDACLLVSDELGGEGRNFQFASHIVHFDLPLAPWMVEQRIGRCDRVGRGEELDVDSQVLVGKGLLDEAFCEFFADGIGVFNDSIAPVEGELDRLMREVMVQCLEGGADGVLDMIEPVAKHLEKARERENAELLVRSAVGVEEARRIARDLNDQRELEELQRQVIRYARLFESMVDDSDEDGRLQVTVGEFHSLHAVPGVRAEMIGYFNRRQAVRHERLDFFSPGHPFVRVLTQTAMTDSPDRAAIIQRKGAAEPVLVCSFRVAMPPEFFSTVRELPADLQPPLLSRSAALFHTRILRIAVQIRDSKLLEQNSASSVYYRDWTEDDVSLHDSPDDLPGMDDGWEDDVLGAAAEALEVAEDYAADLFAEHRADFEDVLVEAMTRVDRHHDASEADIEGLVETLSLLTVDLEAAVLVVPGIATRNS